MPVETLPINSGVEIWERVIQFSENLSLTAARSLLKLQFSADDLDRMRALSAKARAGKLSESEKVEIETYERLGCLLDILHSKSRHALKRPQTKS